MSKYMRNAFLLTVAFVCIVMGILAFKSSYMKTVANAEEPRTPEYYPAAGIVQGFSKYNDMVFVETQDGHVWSFYGIEDWEIGDICLMVMHDDGVRDDLSDDRIVSVRYYGFVG